MTLLLTARRRGGAAGGGGGSLSLTLSGSSQALSYSEPLGLYPDGSARTLFVQFTRTLTNGSPDSGTLTVPGRRIAVNAHRFASGTGSTLVSFGVPLQQGDIPSASIASCTTGTYTDDSATWVNNNTTTWEQGGLPAGVLWPTSAAHLCASVLTSKLVPIATQPSFTQYSLTPTDVDSAFTSTFASVYQAWDGTTGDGSATYERGAAAYDYACITGNIAYLKTAIAFIARERTRWWVPVSWALNETVQEIYMVELMYLLRRDTVALTNLGLRASQRIGQWTSTDWTTENVDTPRNLALNLRLATAVLRCGLGPQYWYFDTSKTYSQIVADMLPLTYSNSTLFESSGRIKFKLRTRLNAATTASYAYMSGLYMLSALDLCDELPASADKTALRAKISAGTQWLKTNMSGTTTGSIIGYWYADTNAWYEAATTTLAAPYTAGAATITINSHTTGGRDEYYITDVVVGGVAYKTATTYESRGGGTVTITLTDTIPSSLSSGSSIAITQQASVSPDIAADLNGMVAAIMAAEALYSSSSTYATEFKKLYASIASTPRDGQSGPQITLLKQWGESFTFSRTGMWYLQQSGL